MNSYEKWCETQENMEYWADAKKRKIYAKVKNIKKNNELKNKIKE